LEAFPVVLKECCLFHISTLNFNINQLYYKSNKPATDKANICIGRGNLVEINPRAATSPNQLKLSARASSYFSAADKKITLSSQY